MAPVELLPPSDVPAVSVASGQMRSFRSGQRVLRAFARLLPPVLTGYALFDKAFAYIQVPGLPIYAGELTVLVGLATAVAATGYFHRGLERSAVAKVIVVFAAWGLFRTVPNVGTYGIDAVRDAALWYYALVAIPVCAVVIWDPELVHRWARGYRRLIPWLLGYFCIGLYMVIQGDTAVSAFVPGTTVSIWDHKPGNFGAQTALAIAFIWLVPGAGGRRRPLLTGVATVLLMIVATQNRGGFVAACVGLAWIWFFTRRRARVTLAMLATVLAILALGWGLNVQVGGTGGRAVSVGQLIQNLQSLGGGSDAGSGGNLQATKKFREHLWSSAIEKVKTDNLVMTGLGFGPNIAKELGVDTGGPNPLRSPHNSHVDIFARMGVTGAALWLALFGAWFGAMLRARSRLRRLGRLYDKALVEVCIVGVTAILVNAYFDPTLESPQVAIWLWTLVGVGMGLVALSRRRPASTTASPVPTAH